MMRRLVVLLIAAGLAAAAVWLPPSDAPPAEFEAEIAAGDMPPALGWTATRGPAAAPFVERWNLVFPDLPPAKPSLTLELGPVVERTASGRLVSVADGDPTVLLERLAFVLGAEPGASEPRPRATVLDLRLELLGDRLSYGPGEVGATVVAGAFATAPGGDWRVYRVTFGGADGPQCFLGLSEGAQSARILARTIADAPAILGHFRALLPPAPPRES